MCQAMAAMDGPAHLDDSSTQAAARCGSLACVCSNLRLRTLAFEVALLCLQAGLHARPFGSNPVHLGAAPAAASAGSGSDGTDSAAAGCAAGCGRGRAGGGGSGARGCSRGGRLRAIG